jgi:hypothetical protein
MVGLYYFKEKSGLIYGNGHARPAGSQLVENERFFAAFRMTCPCVTRF